MSATGSSLKRHGLCRSLPKAPSGTHVARRINSGEQPVLPPALCFLPRGHMGLSPTWAHKAGSHPRAFALAIHLPVTPSPQISTEPLKALVSCADLSSPDCPSVPTPTYTTASTCWLSFLLHALTTGHLTQSHCLLVIPSSLRAMSRISLSPSVVPDMSQVPI